MSAITKRYQFKHYARLVATLVETAAEVQSERLALLLSESIQAIQKLFDMVVEKEDHMHRRILAQYSMLRTFSHALVASADVTETGHRLLLHTGTCTDEAPTRWAEDCPRCLCLVLARADDQPLPAIKTPDFLKPPIRPRKKQSSRNVA